MKKSWGLLPKILEEKKIIECRWYKNKSLPWNKIKKGDFVYFKNSGEPITIKAEVSKVKYYSNLSPPKVKNILFKYGERDGIEKNKLNFYYSLFKNKNYCLLIFIKNPTLLKNPFSVSKKGFGAMSAWMTVDNISKIRLNSQ